MVFVWQHRHLCCKVAVVHRAGQKWDILFVKNIKNIKKGSFCSEFVIPFGREAQEEVNIVHFFSSLGFSLLFWTETWKSFIFQLKHFPAYGNRVLTLPKWSGQVILTRLGKKLVRLNLVCFSQTTLNVSDFIPYIHSGLKPCQDHHFQKKYLWDLWLWPEGWQT